MASAIVVGPTSTTKIKLVRSGHLGPSRNRWLARSVVHLCTLQHDEGQVPDPCVELHQSVLGLKLIPPAPIIAAVGKLCHSELIPLAEFDDLVEIVAMPSVVLEHETMLNARHRGNEYQRARIRSCAHLPFSSIDSGVMEMDTGSPFFSKPRT